MTGRIIKINMNLFRKWLGKGKMNSDEFTKFKKEVLNKYFIRYPKRGLYCDILQENIKVEKEDLKHGLNSKGTIEKTLVLSVLSKVIKTAGIFDIQDDYRGSGKKVYILSNLIEIDKTVYLVRLTVKQGNDNKYYYHHDLFKQKKVS